MFFLPLSFCISFCISTRSSFWLLATLTTSPAAVVATGDVVSSSLADSEIFPLFRPSISSRERVSSDTTGREREDDDDDDDDEADESAAVQDAADAEISSRALEREGNAD